MGSILDMIIEDGIIWFNEEEEALRFVEKRLKPKGWWPGVHRHRSGMVYILGMAGYLQ